MTQRGPENDTPVELTEIIRYPVKSCRRDPLGSAVVEPWGLQGDRRWMLLDSSGKMLTARQCAALVLAAPMITDEGLLLRAPGLEPLPVSRPDGGTLVDVEVWGQAFQAAPAAQEASDWFGQVAGQKVTLVHLDDPTRRQIDPLRSRPGETVSMADGYPVLLANEDSLAALNGWVAEGARAADGPVSMTRFRPNLVVAGAGAWAEDSWRRVRIGATTFRVIKGCDRCVLTLIDPETAVKTKEPLFSLAKHRRWDRKTWFAVNLIADDPGSELHVGDQVEVLERSDDLEPQR